MKTNKKYQLLYEWSGYMGDFTGVLGDSISVPVTKDTTYRQLRDSIEMELNNRSLKYHAGNTSLFIWSDAYPENEPIFPTLEDYESQDDLYAYFSFIESD